MAFRLSAQTEARIKHLAKQNGASISWVINRLLAKSLPGMEKQLEGLR